MSSPLPLIKPISDLRTNLNEISSVARETQQPIFMTKNGVASLVVMDCEAYEREKEHERAVLKLREAEIEARYRSENVSLKQLDERVNKIITAGEELSSAQS